MLKRLELVGFKSFADRTVFEFPAGLTAIVGPNGSGKSNVVDAVKWVLGEQSAKNLRGGEMADVIFSGSSNRRSLGLAEVTLVFDNSSGVLRTPQPEVQIARRVYRDGEGEYLINGQPSRLKDVKDLFLGTGAGAGAYCIIEQGRVDALLQASTSERRSIFEEAAGISRFKAKKIESLRRLEKVEANLQRLRDILAEVENQLRSVRLQAAKAERYQEYSNRLRELRLTLGLREYRRLIGQLEQVEERLSAVRSELQSAADQSAEWTSASRKLESELAALDAAARAETAAISQAQVTQAGQTADLAHERARAASLETETARTRDELADESRRISEVAAQVTAVDADLAAADDQCARQQDQVAQLADISSHFAAEIERLQRHIETDQAEHLERLRLAARTQNEAVSAHAQWEQLRRERDRLSHKSSQASEHLATLDSELETLAAADADLQRRLNEARQSLAEGVQALDDNRHRVENARRRLSDERARLSGLTSRIEILEGLERSHDGLGAGIRELLAELDSRQSALDECIIGLVGDWLSAPRDIAHLLDIALGSLAECFVVRQTDRLLLALHDRREAFTGRVRFLPIRTPASEPFDCTLACPPEVVRCDRLVTCEHADLQDLSFQLLGTTWLVPDLVAAQDLARRLPDQRFVTANGDLIEADGSITVGTHHAEAGILSRKSELRALRVEAQDAELAVQVAQIEVADGQNEADRLQRTQRERQREIDVLAEQAADLREHIGQRRERREGLHEEVTISRSELSELEADLQRLSAAWTDARERSEVADREARELHARIGQFEIELRRCETERVTASKQHTAAQVQLAHVQERRNAVAERRTSLGEDLEERQSHRREIDQKLGELATRNAACALAQLRATDQLAELHRSIEQAESRLGEVRHHRSAIEGELRELHQRMQIAHEAWQARQEEVHAAELSANDLRLRRGTLVERLRDDHQIDLEEAHRESTDGPIEPAIEGDAESEIEELRRKLGRLGSVNLDSLQELAELEHRHSALQVQYDDLTAAQKSLLDIIATINEDSRRLFTETFALVRTNFQDLFRRLFGGGQADILLENEADVLESGVEVMARPPGKELRSISLMSGGEKTLTAVALLLAIFRSKPSPFCLLDEVDAALDEANTGRLGGVIREFLDRSQFIIVTHSKRTMATADVLYGVTMEESGVSKRVAVRFEDWPEDRREAA
jgi:chromosome segregation protein